MKVQFPLEYIPDTRLISYPDETRFFSKVEILGLVVVADYYGFKTLIPYTPITTDITVAEPRIVINTPVVFDFTTNLPDDTYYMPVSQVGVDKKKLFIVNVVLGVGTLTVNFSESGVYYINKEDLDTELTVNGSLTDRFTLYVGE